MPHQTFYRKYRQKKFADLYGQDHIKAVLLNSLTSGKIGQAYLFTGPRGTGKTTTARLLARAINCQNLDSGEPCNQCSFCQLTISDRALDIIEIDAASNRGIDEIRDLRERVNFPPQVLKKKIYIIDEVHMLTTDAFNALLKTLEEPPAHVVFILATTEPHKVPATIQSRTQRLNFHLGTEAQIFNHLKEVASLEGLQLTDEALKLLALTADGGFRDALSLLEQVASHDQEIDEDQVRQILGLASNLASQELVAALLANDRSKSLEILDQLIEQGVNPIFLHRLLVDEIRKVLREQLGILPKRYQNNIAQTKVLKILEDLLNITPTVRTSPLPYLPIEIVIAKNTSQTNTPVGMTDSVALTPDDETTQRDVSTNEDPWQQVLSELESFNHSITRILADAQVEQKDKEIVVNLKYKFHADQLMEPKNHQKIESAIEKIYDQKLTFTCSLPSSSSIPSKLSSNSEPDLVQAAEEIFK